jgi:hypothetical protein
MNSAEINNELFILPNIDIGEGSAELLTMVNLTKEQLGKRWMQGYGSYVVSRWRGSGFKRDVLDDLVGKLYGQTDLRGIDLSGLDLSGCDLSHCDMFSANLRNADLSRVNLNHTWLSEADIQGTILEWASMNEVLIDNARFNKRTNLYGVNLAKVDFTLAWPLRSFAVNQQRIADLQSRYPVFARCLEITTDYGRSFPRFFAWCVGVVLFFAIPFSLSNMLSAPGFWNAIYYSAATFTSLNTDLYPISVWAKILSVAEVSLGYAMLAMLATMLAKRVFVD